MAKQLKIRGGILSAPTGLYDNSELKITHRATVRVEAARGAWTEPETVEINDQDVVILELEGGLNLWIRGDDFQREFSPQAKRGAMPEVWELSPDLLVGSPARGVGKWLLKALEVLGVDLAGNTAREIAKRVENRLGRAPGLYACPLAGEYTVQDLPAALPTARPLLVFIHGTASSTLGSFGQLWHNPPALETLARTYGATAYAFEHRSLTDSPIRNARDLVNALPEGARLHLVTHSRGGLVGELLCRGQCGNGRDPFTEAERRLFQEWGDDLKDLEILNEVLKAKHIQVERFVRVACPARGTTLASGRLDRWLSVVVSLVGQIPGLTSNPLYEVLTEFVLAVTKEHTDPKSLPGLHAMMPDSPLIRVLNLTDVMVDADLSVISGDIDAQGVWATLKLLIPDLFYGGDHDLVVNTGSMYGGAKRKLGGARFFLDEGSQVSHFRYFGNAWTAQRLLDGLTRPQNSQAGFDPIEKAHHEAPARTARGPAGPRPVVFLLPDVMGSHLAMGGVRIWLNLLDLAAGGLKQLEIDAAGVEPQTLVGIYRDLADYLSDTHRVITFPYDWRQSVREAAKHLAEAVKAELGAQQRANQPVHLLAHGMGGLVAQAMIAGHPLVWRQICDHTGGRLIMLGTPTRGDYETVRRLVGQAVVLKQLALLDIAHDSKALLNIITRYPGVLELLPQDDQWDFFNPATWHELQTQDPRGNWVLPEPERLRAAAESRRALKASPIDSARTIYVAGCSSATPCGLRIAEDEDKDGRYQYIEFLATARGDGQVLWDTGIPEGIRPYYLEVEHGELVRHKPAFPALLELLQTGQTTYLKTQPPTPDRAAPGRGASDRDMPESFPLPQEKVPMLPDEDDLAAAALGARRRYARRKAPVREVKVSITHGNLGYARHPVAVGHYYGDTIVGAEAHLDRALQGRLRRHQQLGLYPGLLNSTEVFLDPDPLCKPGGAIVVGLGRVGDLSPGSLAASFARAALTYALAMAEHPDGHSQTADVSRTARISSLLIGTGAGGFSVEESVNAILRGVVKANTLLQETGYDRQITLDELEFIELWQDMAIQTGHALEQIENDPELQGYFNCDPKVRQGTGGLRRVQWQDDPAWWHRLQILADEQGALRFCTLTDRARVEVSLLPTQRALVDQFIEHAVTTTDSSEETARTLFELLVPNRIKEQAPNRHSLVLILNESSARYPWEMLEDRWGDSIQPLAVQAGVIRQLETQAFRERVQMTTDKTAYVVGDPLSNFAPLPGAEAEATQVADQLTQQGFKVERQIRAKPQTIVTTLHARAYRLLHLAGHGVHEEVLEGAKKLACELCNQPLTQKPTKVSGMVIGDNIFLTPADIEQMRQVPELVFINCCHLGRTDSSASDTRRDRHKLAANVATQFVRMGVKAVVAAGWAVDDAAAQTFAGKFYEALLQGQPFGEAARLARSESYRRHPGINTWGAYQCYGDPDYQLESNREKLDTKGAESGIEWKGRLFVSLAELAVELENLAAQAKTADDQETQALKDRLDQILRWAEGTEPAWLKRAEVAAALGLGFGELGEFEKATTHLDTALRTNQALLSIRAVEQRANFKSRWALELVRSGHKVKDKVNPAKLIEEAIDELKALNGLAPTAERWSLLGGAHKRYAWTAKDKRSRIKALKDMAANYHEAHRYQDRQGKLDTYPLFNWLAAGILLQSYDEPDPFLPAGLEDWCSKAEASARQNEAQDPNFWNSVVQPQCDLIRALAGHTLDAHKAAIITGYRRAKRRGASRREFQSVLDHLAFLAEMMAGAGRTKAIQRQAEILREISDRLTGFER